MHTPLDYSLTQHSSVDKHKRRATKKGKENSTAWTESEREQHTRGYEKRAYNTFAQELDECFFPSYQNFASKWKNWNCATGRHTADRDREQSVHANDRVKLNLQNFVLQ